MRFLFRMRTPPQKEIVETLSDDLALVRTTFSIQMSGAFANMIQSERREVVPGEILSDTPGELDEGDQTSA